MDMQIDLYDDEAVSMNLTWPEAEEHLENHGFPGTASLWGSDDESGRFTAPNEARVTESLSLMSDEAGGLSSMLPVPPAEPMTYMAVSSNTESSGPPSILSIYQRDMVSASLNASTSRYVGPLHTTPKP
jgi:hypothetical protein